MAFIKQGTCNRCGQCCGADGSPNQTNPWPKNWPDAIKKWQYVDFEGVMGQAGVVGLQEDAITGEVEQIADYGNFTLKGDTIDWRWVPNNGLCKNLEPAADPNTFSLECPMLLPDTGDGRRECVLVGSKYEWMYLGSGVCYPEGPEVFATQAMLDQWETDHPLCSHTWTEEIEE